MGKSFSELENCLKNKTDGIVLSTWSLVSDELGLSQYFCFSLPLNLKETQNLHQSNLVSNITTIIKPCDYIRIE